MTENAWRSFDTADPIYTWTLELLLPAPHHRFEVLAQLGRAGDDSGVFTLRRVALPGLPCAVDEAGDNSAWIGAARSHQLVEILPFEDAFCAADPPAGVVEVVSTVSFVRAGAGVVTERHSDAGQLLRSLFPDAEPRYRDRFFAPHPFIAPWSTTEGQQLRVELGFWCDLWFDQGSPQLAAANAERLARFRQALEVIAGEFQGRLSAPPA